MTNRYKQGTFSGAAGLELYYQSWHPPTAAKAVVILVHGHGGHSDLFINLVEYLVQRDYSVYSFDLRGHGRSPGQRGYINSWTEYRGDLTAFIQLVTDREPDLPWFLLGQSLGGTIALDYVLTAAKQPQGLILLSPALSIGVVDWKMAIGKVLSRILPRFSLDSGIDLAAGSRDPEVVAAYAQDPIRHSRGTARLVTELLQAIERIDIQAQKLSVPVLILHGGADYVTFPDSSRVFFNRLTLEDKELKEYPDSYHELQNDLNYLEVLADIENWLARHLFIDYHQPD